MKQGNQEITNLAHYWLGYIEARSYSTHYFEFYVNPHKQSEIVTTLKSKGQKVNLTDYLIKRLQLETEPNILAKEITELFLRIPKKSKTKNTPDGLPALVSVLQNTAKTIASAPIEHHPLIILKTLIESGWLSQPILSISPIFKKNQDRYKSLIESAPSEDWINFVLESIVEGAQMTTQRLEKIEKLREKYEKQISIFGPKFPLYQKLIYHLFDQPVTSPRIVERFLEVAPATANKILRELEKLKIVHQTSDNKRNRMYALNKYLELFEQ